MNFKFLIILFCLTFCFKLGTAFYFAEAGNCGAANGTLVYIYRFGAISFAGGDTPSYLGAIDNLVEENEYYFRNGEKKVSAGRMPYYGVPYFLLRQVFDKFSAADLLVIWQIAFSSLAAICFGLLCLKITGNFRCFWFGYALYCLSFNLSALDIMLIPESLALSFTVIFLYFCHQYQYEKKTSAFWAASLFLALLTLLKPYFVMLYPFFYFEFAAVSQIFNVPYQREKITVFVFKSLISGLILVFSLLPWAIRNYIVLDKIIFSQENVYAGYDYKESDLAFRRFTAAWGGDFIFLNPQSRNPTNYFIKEFSATHNQLKLPPHAFAESYGIDEVERVRRDYLQIQENYSPDLDASVTQEFDRLTAIYKNERPLMYYVGSGFIAAKRLILHTNSEFLQAFINPANLCYESWQACFRIVNAAIYIASVLFGFIGIGILSVKKRISIMFAVVPLFLISYFAFYDGYASARYFIPACPVLLLGTVFVLNCFSSKRRQLAADDNQN